MRPWEAVPPRPWETQQPVYPRIVTIHRPNANNAPGDRGYSGLTKAAETVVASNLSASIQLRSRGGEPDASVPADAYGRASWNIFIPVAVIAIGTVTENDVIVDDLGKRYQVAGAEWSPLGYNITADLLKP
jgi:hypothetical protein